MVFHGFSFLAFFAFLSVALADGVNEPNVVSDDLREIMTNENCRANTQKALACKQAIQALTSTLLPNKTDNDALKIDYEQWLAWALDQHDFRTESKRKIFNALNIVLPVLSDDPYRSIEVISEENTQNIRKTKPQNFESSEITLAENTTFLTVKLPEFVDGVTKQLEALLATKPHVDGVIIDLRDNRGGLVTEALGVASIFLPDGLLLLKRVMVANGKEFLSHSRSTLEKTWILSQPLFVITNSNTASASEIVAAALQDYKRATVIGTKTRGKGCTISSRFFKDRPNVKEFWTNAFSFRPSGQPLHKVGIIPDIKTENPEDYLAKKSTRQSLLRVLY